MKTETRILKLIESFTRISRAVFWLGLELAAIAVFSGYVREELEAHYLTRDIQTIVKEQPTVIRYLEADLFTGFEIPIYSSEGCGTNSD